MRLTKVVFALALSLGLAGGSGSIAGYDDDILGIGLNCRKLGERCVIESDCCLSEIPPARWTPS
jgi:hypothetical protein